MTAEDKQYVLAELQEVRLAIRKCLEDLRTIKQEIGLSPIRVKRRTNKSLDDHNIDRSVWQRLFVEEYGQENYEYINRHRSIWVAMGYVKPLFLRQQYAMEVSPSGRLGIRTLIAAIEKYRDFNELKFRV